MLPGATVPCSLADLVTVFRPCFTAATFRTFIGLVVGLIGQTRRERCAGCLPVPAWSSSGITAVRINRIFSLMIGVGLACGCHKPRTPHATC
jgi:hypothetical protein